MASLLSLLRSLIALTSSLNPGALTPSVYSPEHPTAGRRVKPEPANRELKYVFPERDRPLILSYLQALCPQDSNFSTATVSSLYYDTATLAAYAEKRNSDYLKTKVRLRWYTAPLGCGVTSPNPMDYPDHTLAFLEVKQKLGSTREKQRYRLWIPNAQLLNLDLSHGYWRSLLWDYPAVLGVMAGTPQPLLVVRYQRHRFIDALTQSRISVDGQIHCPASILQGHRSQRSDTCPLEHSVLEVKGRETHLPLALRSLAPWLTQEHFSKYASLCEQLL